MAAFAVETDVRKRFQLEDASVVSSDLVLASIADAHTEVLARLAPTVDTETPPERLVLGEVLLAGAHVLTSMASKDAAEQKDLSLGGQRIRAGDRFASLLALASKAEARAWWTLGPYLTPPPGEMAGGATDSVAVLGTDGQRGEA